LFVNIFIDFFDEIADFKTVYIFSAAFNPEWQLLNAKILYSQMPLLTPLHQLEKLPTDLLLDCT